MVPCPSLGKVSRQAGRSKSEKLKEKKIKTVCRAGLAAYAGLEGRRSRCKAMKAKAGTPESP